MSKGMYQEINLYQPIFRRQRQIFSAATMLGIVGTVSVALATIWLVGVWQAGALETEAIRLEGQERALTQRLASLDTGAGERRRHEVERDIERLTIEVDVQQRLIGVLADRPLASTDGFSPHLTALARRHRSGVWLTDIAIDGGSGAIELTGHALSADRVAAYLQDLSHESALSGQRFELMRIERSENEAGVVFRVSSPSATKSERRGESLASAQ
jgi:Tfp pilus assembly protein PilN